LQLNIANLIINLKPSGGPNEKRLQEGFNAQPPWNFSFSLGAFVFFRGNPMNAKGFKRKLSAILSADVVGYSRLMRDDEEYTVRTLNSL
jgi:hypothetical protein